MPLEGLGTTIRYHGVSHGLMEAGYRVVNRVFSLKYYLCRRLEAPLLAAEASLPADCQFTVLDREWFENANLDPTLELAPSSIEAGLSNGDECIAILDSGAIIAYSWVATAPTPVAADFVASCMPGHGYAYKWYTRPSHRGRGLVGLCVIEGLRRHVVRGGQGLMALIERTNLSAQKAAARVGFVPAGQLLAVRLRGWSYVWNSRECRRTGLELLDGRNARMS